MKQPVRAGEYLDECAEIHDLAHFTHVQFANLCLLHDTADDLFGLIRSCFVRGSDVDDTAVLNVNLCPRLLDNAPNDLASASDDVLDLVGIDLHADDTRCERIKVLAGRGEGLEHFAENM